MLKLIYKDYKFCKCVKVYEEEVGGRDEVLIWLIFFVRINILFLILDNIRSFFYSYVIILVFIILNL